VHLHFRVRREGLADFTSQLYFDDALSDAVLANAPYTSHLGSRPRNSQDGIFVTSGGSQLVLGVEQAGAELRASFDVALPL
jgi:protocatechuate 3,4-dioxygenase beta subunit